MAQTQPSESVLIAEDSPDTLAMLADTVEAAGYVAMVALRGDRALAIARSAMPDIILLDAVMPGLDGFQTCKELKRDRALARVPVIFMTGLSDPRDVVRGLESGGVDYLTKPVDTRELIARIRIHLASARLERTAWSALDDAGRHLMAASATGRILWWTRRAGAYLSPLTPEGLAPGARLPDAVAEALGANADVRDIDIRVEAPGAPAVRIRGVSRSRDGEVVLRVQVIGTEADTPREALLQSRFGLSAREVDVLTWLAKGKANRDIAEILGLSPRTVNKHLERVFRKLGVENRTAAAAAVHAAGIVVRGGETHAGS